MPSPLPPIGVREFVFKYQQRDDLFDVLPELDFIKPLADRWKAQGCACGLSDDITKATEKYNLTVSALEAETIQKIKEVFELGNVEICFGLQTVYNFTTKCYV